MEVTRVIDLVFVRYMSLQIFLDLHRSLWKVGCRFQETIDDIVFQYECKTWKHSHQKSEFFLLVPSKAN